MAVKDQKRTAEFAAATVDMLCAHNEGMEPDQLLAAIRQSFPLEHYETVPNRYHGYRPFEQMILTAAIALVGAGWLSQTDDNWKVTDEGRAARKRLPDPVQFFRSAGKISTKAWLVINWPRVFKLLSRLLNQYHIEVRTARRLGMWFILKNVFGFGPAWKRSLSLQAPLRFKVPGLTLVSYEDLESYLGHSGLRYNNAGHTFYLPPDSVRSSALSDVMTFYPESAGLKIIKKKGKSSGGYVYGGIRKRRISVWYNWITYNRDQLCLVANLFYSKGIGPRIYDLVEIEFNGHIWSAYVVEHVDGRMPTVAECEAGIAKIKNLEDEKLVKLTLTEGYQDQDLTPPACNNNAFIDRKGNFSYVDFQSFLLINYESYLASLAADLNGSSDQSDKLDGTGSGSPTVRGEARQFVSDFEFSDRIKTIGRLLNSAGVDVSEKLVLNFGSNDGLTIAYFLSQGARWCHGWVGRASVPKTEGLLLALGCNRFSLCDTQAGSMEDNQGVPEFLAPLLEGCIVVCDSPLEYDHKLILEQIKWAHLVCQPDVPNNDTPLDYRIVRSANYRGSQGRSVTMTLYSNEPAELGLPPAKLAVATGLR